MYSISLAIITAWVSLSLGVSVDGLRAASVGPPKRGPCSGSQDLVNTLGLIFNFYLRANNVF